MEKDCFSLLFNFVPNPQEYYDGLNEIERTWLGLCAKRYGDLCRISEEQEDPTLYWDWFNNPVDPYSGRRSNLKGKICVFPRDATYARIKDMVCKTNRIVCNVGLV
jgi:hypothetical protein